MAPHRKIRKFFNNLQLREIIRVTDMVPHLEYEIQEAYRLSTSKYGDRVALTIAEKTLLLPRCYNALSDESIRRLPEFVVVKMPSRMRYGQYLVHIHAGTRAINEISRKLKHIRL